MNGCGISQENKEGNAFALAMHKQGHGHPQGDHLKNVLPLVQNDSYPWERRSWHDWIMVMWTTALRVYEQAAHLLLIAHFMDTTNNWTKDVCAVNSLSGNKPKPDNLLPFFNGDTIE